MLTTRKDLALSGNISIQIHSVVSFSRSTLRFYLILSEIYTATPPFYHYCISFFMKWYSVCRVTVVFTIRLDLRVSGKVYNCIFLSQEKICNISRYNYEYNLQCFSFDEKL